jgi:hypothetical protein
MGVVSAFTSGQDAGFKGWNKKNALPKERIAKH